MANSEVEFSINSLSGPRLKRGEWEVRKASLKLARDLVEEYHYAHGSSKTAVYVHGLFKRKGAELFGAAIWLPPTRVACESVNKANWTRVLSLSRLAIKPEVPNNGASFLIAGSIRLIKEDGRFASLVTYADESQGHTGAIYRATNWAYVGKTGPYLRWEDPFTGRQVAQQATKTRTVGKMLELGYVKAGRFYKHKFVMHLEV